MSFCSLFVYSNGTSDCFKICSCIPGLLPLGRRNNPFCARKYHFSYLFKQSTHVNITSPPRSFHIWNNEGSLPRVAMMEMFEKLILCLWRQRVPRCLTVSSHILNSINFRSQKVLLISKCLFFSFYGSHFRKVQILRFSDFDEDIAKTKNKEEKRLLL